ncbi:hypothetical protein SEPCBS57363_001512 [Sporothrix epigloea]|uniref:Uncharacterized protein n=1 Tax=Sporothrix epigloea TaxID=1892477 RepID=A0ABP0DCC7_9PEZI
MSLPELASFAISGSAATALSSLITDRVPAPLGGAVSAKSKKTKRTATAANGFVFFSAYYMVATTRLRLSRYHNNPSSTPSTRWAASQAFLIGTTASVCTRLLGPGDPALAPSDMDKPESQAPPRHKWSPTVLTDSIFQGVDPGLTFAIHEILARIVAQHQWRLLSSKQQQHGKRVNGIYAAAITFILATFSKAIAKGITHPLYVAATAAEAERQRRWLFDETGESETEDGTSVLATLWKMLRHPSERSALYTGWLRAVITASLGHGLTMAFQRILYGVVLQLVHRVSQQLRERQNIGQEHRVRQLQQQMSLSSIKAQNGSCSSEANKTPRSAQQLPELADNMPLDDHQQVAEAVESWLESTAASPDTMKANKSSDDALQNLPLPYRAPSPGSDVLSTTRGHQDTYTNPWAEIQQKEKDIDSASIAPSATEGVLVRLKAPSQADTNMSQKQEATFLEAMDSTDDDTNSNVIFNMISKSPRTVKREASGVGN